MGRKRKSRRGKAIVDAGAAALATLAPAGAPAAAAWSAAAIASRICEWAREKMAAWNEERRHKLFEGFADPDGAALLERLIEEDWCKSAIRSALRDCEEALDDAVVPVLGRLLRNYLAGERRRGWFFRGVSRAVVDLSAPELVAFQRVVDMVLAEYEAEKSRGPEYVDIGLSEYERTIALVGMYGGLSDRARPQPVIPEARRLIEQLRQHHLLVYDPPGGGGPRYTLSGFEYKGSMAVEVAKELRGVLGCGPGAELRVEVPLAVEVVPDRSVDE